MVKCIRVNRFRGALKAAAASCCVQGQQQRPVVVVGGDVIVDQLWTKLSFTMLRCVDGLLLSAHRH